MIRLLSSGELDPTFSGDGSVVLELAAATQYTEVMATAIRPLPNGGVLVAGNTSQPGESRGLVTRLLEDGAVDASFADAGQHVIDVGAEWSDVGGLDVLDDGRVLVALHSNYTFRGPAGGPRPAGLDLVRLTADGAPDRSFGADGVVTPAVGDERPLSLQRDGQGRFVLPTLRERPNGGTPTSSVLRLLADGTPDASFEGGGRAPVPALTLVFGGGVVVRPDGGLTVMGSTTHAAWRTAPLAPAVLGLLGTPGDDPAPPTPPPPPPSAPPAPPPPAAQPPLATPSPQLLPRPPVAPGLARPLTLSLSVARGQTRATIRRRGLKLRIRCSTACRVSAATSMRRGGRTLGTGRRTASLAAAGTTTFSVRLPARARRALARRGRTVFASRATAVGAGAQRIERRRSLTLTR